MPISELCVHSSKKRRKLTLCPPPHWDNQDMVMSESPGVTKQNSQNLRCISKAQRHWVLRVSDTWWDWNPGLSHTSAGNILTHHEHPEATASQSCSEHSAAGSHNTESHLGLVAVVPTLGLLLTHHDLLIGWRETTGKQQAWFPVHLALQRVMCGLFTTHEKLNRQTYQQTQSLTFIEVRYYCFCHKTGENTKIWWLQIIPPLGRAPDSNLMVVTPLPSSLPLWHMPSSTPHCRVQRLPAVPEWRRE